MHSLKQRCRNGQEVSGNNGQSRMVAFLYGTVPGRILLKPLVCPAVSKAAGHLLSGRLSCLLIKPFVRRHGIDLSQFQQQTFDSYNAFFTRKIRPEERPVDMEPSHLISPCDSKLTVLPITSESRFTLKHTAYTVASLLKDEALASRYEGGYCLIFRLTVDDYHRFCYVDQGEKSENIRIPGVFHTVNPIANDTVPIYKENTREYSILHSAAFSDIVMMEVGAMMVGKIVNHHEAAVVERGQEKGYFQFGGSTVVLLFRKNVLTIDSDIMENSRLGIETVVRYGEKIGMNAIME